MTNPISIEVIPCGESREIVCGSPNSTRTINMSIGTIYIFTCLDNNVSLGAFTCSLVGLNISEQRIPSGVKVILQCNC
ncbi:hypothetical protein CN469_13440 [Bacillus cereus]|nr:hypothetical protein CN469_13440 [Bacillus cereus]